MHPEAVPAGLCLFGTPRLDGPDPEREADLLARPKTLALLGYLALAQPRGLRRRDELLALFWPDSDADHARNSLRQALHSLRRVLPTGAIVSRGNHEVGLAPGVVGVDVWRFEQALDHGTERDALAGYAGDLLVGFTLHENPEFDAWLIGERDRLRRRAVRGASVLARQYETDGDCARAVEWARYALDRAPYDEGLLRDVMSLLHRHGERAGAAEMLATFTARTGADLGVTLSVETAQLSRALLHDNLAPVQATQAFVTPSAFVAPRVVHPEARLLSLKARQLAMQRSPLTILSAIELYERALRLSPDYAEAHVAIASAYCQATVYSPILGSDAWPRVRAHATRALRLDARIGEAHAMHAHATLCSEYDWETAERGYRRALELDPTSWVSRQLYALYLLVSLGRHDEAMAILNRARDEMPDVPGISAFCGMACVFSRHFAQALVEMEYLIEAQPDFAQAYWVRGMAQEATGDFAAAIGSFEYGAALTRNSGLFVTQLARASAASGDHARARSLLNEYLARDEQGGPGNYFCAEVFAALGDSEQALDRLQVAYRQRNPLIVFARVLYGLDPLRDTRRFRDLLARIGLAGQLHSHVHSHSNNGTA